MTLTLRCLRCGDWAEMDPTSTRTFGLCVRCSIEGAALLAWEASPKALMRWSARWQKHAERHPTWKALTAALDAMERAEHGRLSEIEP